MIDKTSNKQRFAAFTATVIWLAFRGVLGRGRRVPTAIAAGAVGLTVMLAVFVLSALYTYQISERKAIEDNPLNLALWLGHPIVADKWIGSADLARLTQIQQTNSDITSFHACREVWMDFYLVGTDGSVSLRGRTVTRDDPLAKKLPINWENGIAGTRKLFEQINLREPATFPQDLYLRDAFGQKTSVTLHSVIDTELPWDQLFLVSDEWYERNYGQKLRAFGTVFETGPLPEGLQVSERELPKDIQKALGQFGLRPPKMIVTNGVMKWRVETWEASGMGLRDVAAYLRRICELVYGPDVCDERLDIRKFIGELKVLDGEPNQSSTANEYSDKRFPLVVVYVKALDKLAQIKEILEKQGFSVRDSNDMIRRLDQIGKRISSLWQIALILLIFSFCSLFGALVGLQVIRIDARRREIGMLQALGMGRMQVSYLVVVEGFLVWSLGAPLGLIIGWALAQWTSRVLLATGSQMEQASIGLALPISVLCTILGGTLIISVLSLLASVWTIINVPPIVSLMGASIPSGRRSPRASTIDTSVSVHRHHGAPAGSDGGSGCGKSAGQAPWAST